MAVSAIIFSHYYAIGDEGANFQPGARVLLDPYDGFSDQALDAVEPGTELFFLLSDPRKLPRIEAKRPCGELREMREQLDRAPMISGKLVENAGGAFVFEVHKRETFQDVVGRKPLSVTNEALSEVARYKKFWEQAAESRRSTGFRYSFRFVCGLPSVSSVEEALRNGFHCSVQKDFGSYRPPLLQPPSSTEPWWSAKHSEGPICAFPLFLERLSGTSGVRVIALGDNDIDSSRVFDSTNVNEYQASIRGMLETAELKEEASCWSFLLSS